jgi:hypothetical protein
MAIDGLDSEFCSVKEKPDGVKEAVLDLRILHGIWRGGRFYVSKITPLLMQPEEEQLLRTRLNADAAAKLSAEF